MFNKLATNIKNKLPDHFRKKMSEDEESPSEEVEEYSEEFVEESHDSAGNEEAESEPDAQAEKKKKISMLIRVIIIIALGYMIVTEVFFKEDQSIDVPVVAQKNHKPRKKILPKNETKPAEKVEEKIEPNIEPNIEPKIEAVVEAKVEEKSEAKTDKPPIENINIIDKKTEEIVAKEEAPKVEAVEPKETKPSQQSPSEVAEVKVSQKSVDENIDKLIDNIDGVSKLATPSKNENLEAKISDEGPYTAPPSYDQMGRGLVYNCKEKHWACVDKIGYLACNKNMKWNKSNGKPSECVIQNVYSTDDDCAIIQKYNISTNKETKFCD